MHSFSQPPVQKVTKPQMCAFEECFYTTTTTLTFHTFQVKFPHSFERGAFGLGEANQST